MPICPHCKYRFEDAEALRRHLEEGDGCPQLHDDREAKTCPRCGQICTYDGWDHVHPDGVGIGSCQ